MNPLSIPTSCCRTNTWSYPGSGLTGPQDSPTKVLTTRFLKLRDLPKRNTRKEVYKPESLHKFHKIHAIHNITAFESKHLGMPCAPRSKPSVPLLGTLPFPAVRASRNSSRWSLEGWCSSISNEKLYQIHTKFVLFLIKCGLWDFSGGVHAPNIP